jgi:hypothetical protein
VDQENKGDGMRTERVTLEVTHDDNDGHIQFRNWDQMLFGEQNGVRFPGESVRVVEEAHFDDLAQVAMERDAAIRERDDLRKSWLRSEESGTRLLAERNAALDAADGLRKRVSELEAASGGGEGEPVAWGVMSIADPPHRVWLSWDQELAERWARQKQCDYNSQLVVVPLYRQPPQPRGWLTGEEKAAIRWAMSEGFDEDVFRNLLARSTPPGPEGDG